MGGEEGGGADVGIGALICETFRVRCSTPLYTILMYVSIPCGNFYLIYLYPSYILDSMNKKPPPQLPSAGMLEGDGEMFVPYCHDYDQAGKSGKDVCDNDGHD